MTKAHFKIIRIVNTGRSLGWLIAGTLAIGSLLFWLIEPASAIDSFYWAGTTMTTTGYGDVTPVTAFGKIFAVAFMFWSIVIVANVITYVHDKTHPDEAKFTHAEQEWLFNEVEGNGRALGRTPAPQPADHDHTHLTS